MKNQVQNNNLSQFFSDKKSADKIIFSHENQKINWEKFCQLVAFFSERIRQRKEQNWCIFCEDIFLFSVGFFALLQADKKITIIPNIQPGNLQSFAQISEAILSDIDIPDSPLFALKIHNEAEIHQEFALKNPDINQILTFFTSGSSGEPKQIQKTLAQLETEISVFEELFGNEIDQNIVFTSSVSQQHIYGFLFSFLWPLYRGNPVYQSTIITSEDLAQVAQNNKILFISSPAFLKRLNLEHIKNSNKIFSNISHIFSSGGLLRKAEAYNVAEFFNNFPIEILGSTETGGVAWRQQNQGENWNILPKVQIKIADNEQLTVKSPFTNENDYIKMGDTAELIGENQFLLKERVDKIVKIEEKRISLTEVENRLLEHEFIQNCCAIILEENRQIIAAIIELNDSGKKFLEENDKLTLNRFLKNHLSQYFEPVTLPRKWRYIEQIPVNSQGKILRANLDKLL